MILPFEYLKIDQDFYSESEEKESLSSISSIRERILFLIKKLRLSLRKN
jgi:hypothetical protein